jgi:nicotinamide-nucleotide amidase
MKKFISLLLLFVGSTTTLFAGEPVMERTKEQLATQLGELLRAQKLTLATAESCTGGGVAAAITSIPGSSAYFKGSIVAYANEVKTELLHVSPETLERHGAVSEETVIEMVRGAMNTLNTDCAVSTSGIAGPGGGTPLKPVGTIWMAAACGDRIVTFKQEGDNGRTQNVEKAIENVLGLLISLLEQPKKE